MARIDYINTGRDRIKCINLSEAVGLGGKNRFGDVLVIQALFRHIHSYSNTFLGLGTDFELPGLSGVLDLSTSQAINQFQITNAGHLLMNYFDGRIDPAQYKGRTLRRLGTGVPLMSITYLHLYATDASLMNGTGDYIADLEKMDVRILDDLIINS